MFGGQVIGQAMIAAGHTVDALHAANSLHAYFLRAGDYSEPLELGVERLRSGRSFSARRVTVRQRGDVLLVLSASFHADEAGGDFQNAAPPNVPPPDELPPTRFSSTVIETRDASYDEPHGNRRLLWFRAPQPLGDDRNLHRGALAYATDHGPFGAARRVVSAGGADFESMFRASLDHAIWFHGDVRADGWLLYDVSVLSHRGARILTHGSVSDADGRLVATVTQEILARSAP